MLGTSLTFHSPHLPLFQPAHQLLHLQVSPGVRCCLTKQLEASHQPSREGRAEHGSGLPEANQGSQSASPRPHPAPPASAPGEPPHTGCLGPLTRGRIRRPSLQVLLTRLPPKGAPHPGPKYHTWCTPPPTLGAPGNPSPGTAVGSSRVPQPLGLISRLLFAGSALLGRGCPRPVRRASGCSWLPLQRQAINCLQSRKYSLSGPFQKVC